MYLRTALPVPFLKQLLARFRTVGKMQDPAAASLVFVTVVALGAEGFCRQLHEWVAPSKIGQWIYVFFHRRHPKVRNRPTILVSLESTGPYQRNGASLVFMRCVVLEIQIFRNLVSRK